jgi:hypothetical protein
MTRQKSPHTQTQQNTGPEQTDFENTPDESQPGESQEDANIYAEMDGAETGTNRSPRTLNAGGPEHNTEPEQEAHEGPVTTRTPKKPAQGITSHSAQEESERQEKVVNQRPDAQAGVKHS